MNDRHSDLRFEISNFKSEISDLRSEHRIRLIDLLLVCMADYLASTPELDSIN
jgi:hypothetical protein